MSALALVFALEGCRDIVAPAPGASALTTRIEIEGGVVRPGEVLRVRIVVSNPTRREAQVQSNCRAPVFRVFDAAGQRVSGDWCPIPESELLRIPPGDFVREISWKAQRVTQSPVSPLPSGSYTLIGGLDLGGTLQAPSEPVSLEVRESK